VKVLFSILLVANLAFFGYGWMVERQRADAPPPLVRDQLNAGKIRIVHGEPEPVAPPAPETCVEWSPFTQDDLARAREALAPLALGDRLQSNPVTTTAGWWVFVPPAKTKQLADREVARLQAAGVRETFIVQETGDMRFAISLGLFRTEEAAQRFLEGLRGRGVKTAKAGPKAHTIRMTALVLRAPTEAEAQRLVELKATFGGTDVRPATCPVGAGPTAPPATAAGV
jgi:hypothetical protein